MSKISMENTNVKATLISSIKCHLDDCKIIKMNGIDDQFADYIVSKIKKLIFEVDNLQQFTALLSKNIEEDVKWSVLVGCITHISWLIFPLGKYINLKFDSVNIVLYK